MMAMTLAKIINGQRRPLRGPSEIQTAAREYTAVKALPMVGYSFWAHSVSHASLNWIHKRRTIWAMVKIGGFPGLLCALSQNTKDWNGCVPNGWITVLISEGFKHGQ